MPWVKFYGGEYLSDPKISTLTPQERSCWITLLCFSATSSVPGIIEFLTVEVLLQKAGIVFDPYHPEEWDKCLSILKKLEKMKMITCSDEGSIEVLNWDKRQETALTATERSRIYRAKHKVNSKKETDATKGNENATLEERREEESRGEERKKEIHSVDILPKQIGEVIKEFESVNPSCSKMYGRKDQRDACSDLIQKYGYDKVIEVVKNLNKTNVQQFFPSIDTPLQLQYKWVTLQNAHKKNSGGGANPGVYIAKDKDGNETTNYDKKSIKI